jgi:hypothetical protein
MTNQSSCPNATYQGPGIRIASSLSENYTAHKERGPGWQFDRSRAVLVQNGKVQYEKDMSDYTYSRSSIVCPTTERIPLLQLIGPSL